MNSFPENKNKEHSHTPLNMGKNPYKALAFYKEEDSGTFHGRGTEKKKLFKMAKYNFLTVVFGKSGIGKTSLLNAGLFPILREDGFLPVKLLPCYESPGLVEQVKKQIRNELKERKIQKKEESNRDTVKELSKEETLWEYFHRVKHFDSAGSKKTLVLVFDQFEDIFKYKENKIEINALIDELYYLIEDQFPKSFKKRILNNKEEEYLYSETKPNVRIIISLREDYLPHLNSLKSRIPSIDRVMFRIIHFNGIQAREIIGMPGGIQNESKENAILRLFYPEQKIENGEKTTDEDLEIEPFILSLLCFQLKRKREKSITKKNQNKILTDFYDSVFKPSKLPKAKELKTFIESKLLTEEGLRNPYALSPDQRLRKPIKMLIEQRVLRRFHREGKEYIEIIHDVLAPIISRKRERRVKRRKNATIAVLSILLIIFIALTWFAFNQKERAQKETRKAESYWLAACSENLLDKDPTLSFRLAERAYHTDKTNPNAYGALLSAYYDNARFYLVVLKHNDNVNFAGFSPTGAFIVTASKDKTAKLWDLNGKEIRKLQHDDYVRCASVSKNGKEIVTVSGENTVTVWSFEEGLGKQQFKVKNFVKWKVREDVVKFAVFSRDGKYIIGVVTKDNQEIVRCWDFKGNPGNKTGAAIIINDIKPSKTHEGKTLIEPDKPEKIVKLRDEDGNEIKFKGHTDYVNSRVFSPNGEYIVTASDDDTARLWRIKALGTGNCENPPDGGPHKPNFKKAVSPDGRYKVSVKWSKTPHLHDTKGRRECKMKGHKKVMYSAAFSPSGKYIVTASMDKTARLWNLECENIQVFKGHEDSVYSACFSPDERYIITASKDATVRLWNLEGTQVFEFKGFDDIRYTASFSLDGKCILITAEDKEPRKQPQSYLVDPEEIIRIVNQNIWQLDEKTKEKYNIEN